MFEILRISRSANNVAKRCGEEEKSECTVNRRNNCGFRGKRNVIKTLLINVIEEERLE